MKNILVPVDFSEPSANALEVAARIANLQGAGITVLHMLGISESVVTKYKTQEFEEARYYMMLARKRFKTFLDKPYLKGIKTNQIVQNYKIFSELNNVAKEQHSDLIVMGSHGTSGLTEFFVGSNTEKVVRTSDIPVMVIKAPDPDFEIKTILFGCDFKDESILAYKNVKEFANLFSAGLKLIYVNTPYHKFISSSALEKQIKTFFYKSGEEEQKVIIYNDYSVEQGLMNYSKEGDYSLLAIPTHGRKRLSHLLLGSIAEDVANRANLPVLTLKI